MLTALVTPGIEATVPAGVFRAMPSADRELLGGEQASRHGACARLSRSVWFTSYSVHRLPGSSLLALLGALCIVLCLNLCPMPLVPSLAVSRRLAGYPSSLPQYLTAPTSKSPCRAQVAGSKVHRMSPIPSKVVGPFFQDPSAQQGNAGSGSACPWGAAPGSVTNHPLFFVWLAVTGVGRWLFPCGHMPTEN